MIIILDVLNVLPSPTSGPFRVTPGTATQLTQAQCLAIEAVWVGVIVTLEDHPKSVNG